MCRVDMNGYQPLSAEPSQGAWAVEVKQQQRSVAQDCERLLMETYGECLADSAAQRVLWVSRDSAGSGCRRAVPAAGHAALLEERGLRGQAQGAPHVPARCSTPCLCLCLQCLCAALRPCSSHTRPAASGCRLALRALARAWWRCKRWQLPPELAYRARPKQLIKQVLLSLPVQACRWGGLQGGACQRWRCKRWQLDMANCHIK